MGYTNFPVGDPLAIQLWSKSLGVEDSKYIYFAKFMGGEDAIIRKVEDLVKKKGEKITIGLRMKLTGPGVTGDNKIEGTSAEEALTFFYDALFIDQLRKGTKSEGRMSEQRVPYDIRANGRDALAVWFGEEYDELHFIYLSGARGIDASFHNGLDFTGFAGNPISAPDSAHHIYAGDATGKADLDSDDKMSLNTIDKALAKIETMELPLRPIMVDGEKKWVFLMHIWDAYDLRNSTSENDWTDIQKRMGPKSLIFKNALGDHDGMVLHKHRNVIRFNDYGATGDVTACRNLVLGAQAGMIAWGGDGGQGRYTWNEETEDRGNALAITAGTIAGMKKATYNSKDFGVIAVDSYCKDPNA